MGEATEIRPQFLRVEESVLTGRREAVAREMNPDPTPRDSMNRPTRPPRR